MYVILYCVVRHMRYDVMALPGVPGGGESAAERGVGGGEEEPGAALSDQPVRQPPAARQHQPAQHVSQRRHRRRRQRGCGPIPGGMAARRSAGPGVGGQLVADFKAITKTSTPCGSLGPGLPDLVPGESLQGSLYVQHPYFICRI